MAFLGSLKKMFGSKGGDERSDLEKKVKASPNDPQVRQKLALVLLKQREVVEGIAELAKAAELYEKDGFEGKAVAVLRQLLKYDIENVEMQQRLIGLLSRQGLTGDAQAVLEKFAGGLARKLTDEQKLEFYGKVAEHLPQTPMPHLYVVDLLLPQHKLFEAVSALEKAVEAALSSGEVARYSERLTALSGAAGVTADHLEPCGFLWCRIGNAAEGLKVLRRVRELAEPDADPARLARIDAVLSAVEEGRDVASGGAVTFADAVRKLEEDERRARHPEPAAQSVAAAPAAFPGMADEAPASGAPAGREAEGTDEAEEDASMVKDALGRLQAKVDEEIGDSDLETRYNLGIAYKEMGLLDEALKEFRIASRKPDLRLGATTLIADVLADRGDVESAVAELDTLTGSGEIDGAGVRDVRYHKAVLLERAGRSGDALEIYLAISVESPGYRDVKARAERLGR